MPLITIKGIEGAFTSEQKQLAIKKIADAMSARIEKDLKNFTK